MDHSSNLNQAKIISELREFLKKVMLTPGSLQKSLELAKLDGMQSDNLDLIKSINKETIIKIPENPEKRSDADKLFLELLQEIINENSALY